MVDWLKTLSLFDHFMHGLFKYLDESTAKQGSFTGSTSLIWASVIRLLVIRLLCIALIIPRNFNDIHSYFTVC